MSLWQEVCHVGGGEGVAGCQLGEGSLMGQEWVPWARCWSSWHSSGVSTWASLPSTPILL